MGWFYSRSIDWLIDWYKKSNPSSSVDWLVDWLPDGGKFISSIRLIDWLIDWLAGWLVEYHVVNEFYVLYLRRGREKEPWKKSNLPSLRLATAARWGVEEAAQSPNTVSRASAPPSEPSVPSAESLSSDPAISISPAATDTTPARNRPKSHCFPPPNHAGIDRARRKTPGAVESGSRALYW